MLENNQVRQSVKFMISSTSYTYVRDLSRPGVRSFSDHSFSEHPRVIAVDFMVQFLFYLQKKSKKANMEVPVIPSCTGKS